MHRCVANGIVAERVTLSVVAHLTALPQLARLPGLSPIRTLSTRNWLSGAAHVSERIGANHTSAFRSGASFRECGQPFGFDGRFNGRGALR
jgi:hypothetical protein